MPKNLKAAKNFIVLRVVYWRKFETGLSLLFCFGTLLTWHKVPPNDQLII